MRRFSVVIAIVAFIASAYLFQKNLPYILNGINALGWLAPVLFLMMYGLSTIFFLPTLILTLAGGALFGPLYGIILNVFGASLGATLGFYLSRYFAVGWVTQQKTMKINKLIQGVEAKGWQFVALLRLLPIIPFNVVNYGLGLTNIKYSHYMITTLIFIMPAEIIYTYCGYSSMHWLPNLLNKRSTLLLIPIGIGFLLIKRFKNHQQKKTTYQQTRVETNLS